MQDTSSTWLLTAENFARTDFVFIESAMIDLRSDLVEYCAALYAEANDDVGDDNVMLSWIIERCEIPAMHPFDGENAEPPVDNTNYQNEPDGYVYLFFVYFEDVESFQAILYFMGGII